MVASVVVTIVVAPVVEASVVVVGCTLVITGFLKGLLPLKGHLRRPCRPLVLPGFCLTTTQLSGIPPEPDDKGPSGLLTEGGLTVGGEGKVCDSGGASTVVDTLE